MRAENRYQTLARIDVPSSEQPATSYASDRQLVDQLVQGDAIAWRTFVQTHGRLVRSRVADVASAFGRQDDDSAIDDATAEVFAALLGNDAAALKAFAGRSSLGTYVAVIATRSATRGFARKRLIVNATDDNESSAVDADPARNLMNMEQQQRAITLLDELPEKQRAIVQLFHLEGKSYAEISERLRIPIGSIGPTLRRAESKLRQWMEND